MLLAAACERHGASSPSAGTLVGALASGAPATRSLEARTSVATRYAPCELGDSLVTPARCPRPGAPDAATMEIVSRAAALMRDSAAADALHASALVDLVWDTTGKSLARSLQSLGQAARYERSASAWADLAAAELARADRDSEPRARLAALDAAARAASADSQHVVARFNLALAAERLGLDGRAREEWMRYLTLERDTGWRSEARMRIAAIDRRAVPSAKGPLDPARLGALAARDPGGLRMRLFSTELGEWSDAMRLGDTVRAGVALAWLRAAGDALAQAHGDSSVADVARELTSDHDVIDAAATFAAGLRASQQGKYAEAEAQFARAAASTRAPNLAAWARTLQAVQQVFTGKGKEASVALRREMRAAQIANRKALEARAGWTLAVLLAREERYTEADEVLARVGAASSAIGDRETAAAVLAQRAEIGFVVGDERTASRLGLDALSTLRAYRGSLRLRHAVTVLALVASERRLSAAAATIRDEEAAVGRASGHPEFHTDARLAATRERLQFGDTARVLVDLRDVERTVATLPPSDATRWTASLAALFRAEAGVPVAPATLDSAVEFFGEQRNGVMLVDALLTRARARVATSARSATEDLDSALTLIRDRSSKRYRTSAERRALERRTHDIAARLALSYLERHSDQEALAAVERGRGTGEGRAMRLAPGTVVLDYLLAGDTLVVFRLAGDRMTTSRTVVPARELAFVRERLVRGAESGPMDRTLSARLYDWLLRPHDAVLRGAERLIVVAGDELAGVPFAALYDSATRQYVVERVSVSVQPRLDSEARATSGPFARALFVSDPAFDRAAFPALAALPGARAEVDASRRFYPGARLLAGEQATPSAVSTAMQRADLVHFASHAVFDPGRPEQSQLVLAREPGASEGLTARTISGMPLRGVGLAVLSSCESTRSGVAEAPFTVGLAQAFHDAGVPSVVGALWRVDDDATAALMAEFHRRLSVTHDVARALREAQLTLLRDSRDTRRDAAAWGAFVFTGR